MKTLRNFLKNETVLAVSLVLAAISAFLVPPNRAYLDYIDWRTLALLFCLMAVMAGLNRLGLFRLLAQQLLRHVKTMRGLGLVLCLLCFFSSMVVTNDVALITFVPFSVITLRCSGETKRMIPLITVETVAANLGSMLTPIGNPQNLYLFSAFHMETAAFFRTVLPYGLLSLLLVIAASCLIGAEPLTVQETEPEESPDRGRCAAYGALFVLSLLTVFRVLPYGVTLAVTFSAVLAFDRKTLNHVDYSLLLTFVFLFVFIGNLGHIAPVSDFLRRIVAGREVLAAVLASQVFSNVPAAILLSGLTADAQALLVGVNLGGLGTLIASMASLISFKFIARGNVNAGRYLVFFTIINLLFLALNLGLYFLINL